MDCHNVIQIRFVDQQNESDIDKILNSFEDTFNISEFDLYEENEVNGITHIKCDFKTAYSQLNNNELQEFCNKHKINIIGVSYAFIYNDVSSFSVECS